MAHLLGRPLVDEHTTATSGQAAPKDGSDAATPTPEEQKPLESPGGGWGQKAFDFALESTKQMITLATGVLAITITFMKDAAGGASRADVSSLKAAWLLFLLSVVFGLLTLLGLTGELERPPPGQRPSIYSNQIRWTSLGQVLAFGGALTATLVFGLRSF